jgi:hypothetical protein
VVEPDFGSRIHEGSRQQAVLMLAAFSVWHIVSGKIDENRL